MELSLAPALPRLLLRPALARLARRVWAASPALAVGAAVCVVGAAATLALAALDARTLGGVRVWVKPFKFFVSIAVYLPAFALVLADVQGYRRTKSFLQAGILAALVIEFVLITLQAGRGVGSHFNVATRFDAAVFSVMGTSIAALMGLMLVAFAVLLRQRPADPAWRWALAGAMGVSVLGGLAAVPMTLPTRDQQAAWQAGTPVTVAGGHTVGAADGGAGLPLVGWSREHGDLRVPHFFGLHALQVLPLVALGLRRRYRTGAARTRATAAAVLGYAGVLGVLFQQAMRGLPLLRPDALTLALLAAVVLAAAPAFRPERPAPTPA